MGFLLVLARVAGVLVYVPLPTGRSSPDVVRAALALVLTLALYARWPAVDVARLGLGRMCGWLAAEASLGLVIGLAVACLAESWQMAAQIAGLEAGYGYASIVDPTTEADSSILLVLAQLMAGLLMMAAGLDRELLRAFSHSLDSWPPGAFALTPALAATLISFSAGIFSTGVRMAMPALALLLLVDLTLALLGRLHLQLQLITLAFPAKMLAALALLVALAPLLARAFGAQARDLLALVTRVMAR